MREYARISPRFWIGPTGRAVVGSGKETTIVALYLLTSPHANHLGLYYLPSSYIVEDTDLSTEEVKSALDTLEKVGMIKYDPAAKFVWVIEMAKYQIGTPLKPGDSQRFSIEKFFHTLPPNAFLGEFHEKYGSELHISTHPQSSTGGIPGGDTGGIPGGLARGDMRHETRDMNISRSSSSESEPKKDGKSTRKRKIRYDEIDVQIAGHLRNLNRDQFDEAWEFGGNIEEHYKHFRLLREKGNQNTGPVSVERIRAVMKWLPKDTFWIPNGNLQSGEKFREKFHMLEAKMKNGGRPVSSSGRQVDEFDEKHPDGLK